jgi:hypothetical protein
MKYADTRGRQPAEYHPIDGELRCSALNFPPELSALSP